MSRPFPHLLSCLLALAAPAALATDESSLLPVDQAFQVEARAAGPGQVALHWTIADGYYLYRQRISASAAGAEAGPVRLPEGEHHQDEYFGAVQTYRHQLDATLPLRPGTHGPVTLKVRYQGCADAGLCYPPQERSLGVTVADAPAPAADGLVLPGTAGSGAGLIPAGPGGATAAPA
ncbi:MAG: protein-disulfide reductase DsbD family protein, partial [Pseudoxanthomonas sp.]